MTRVPIDREVDAVPSIRTEGDVTIIPVVEERIVVRCQLVLREEVHVRNLRAVSTVRVPVELRRQTVP